MFKLPIVLVLIDFSDSSSPLMVDLLTSTTTNFEVKKYIGQHYNCKLLLSAMGRERSNPTIFVT